MEFYEKRTLHEAVNTKGSKLWIMMNDNSKARKNRDRFVAQHGGFFTQEGRYWKWTTPQAEQNGYWLKRVDTGEEVFFTNMGEFAKAQGMTSVKICELLNGKRKTYKGWTAVELRDVRETVGSIPKVEEPKAQKIRITKSYVLIDISTNEIINVPNLFKFAKDNNLSYDNLKKLVKGKSKTFKNLKVYDPLAQYKDSSEPK